MGHINIFNYLYEFMGRSKLYYSVYLTLIPITSVIHNYLIPELIGKFYVDISTKSTYLLHYLALCLFVLFCLHILINWMALRVIPDFYHYVVLRIYSYIYHNTFCNYDNLNITEIIVKISKLPFIFADILKSFKEEFCHVFYGAVVGMFYLYYKLGMKYLVTFAIYLVCMITLQIINIRHLTQLNEIKEDKEDIIFDKMSESLKHIGVVQSFQNVGTEKNIMYNILNEYNNAYLVSLKYIILYDGFTKSLNLCMGILIGYMIWTDYLKHKINKQYVLQCSQVILILLFLFDSIGMVSRAVSMNLSQIYDINSFFNKEVPYDETCRTGTDTFNNGDIVFKNVYHKYDSKFVIENVSFTIHKGDKIALVGGSGSGKSTIIKLIMKHIPTLLGSVTIGGVNNNNLTSAELAKHIMYIPQEPKLFNRSLYDNIIYGLKRPPTRTQIMDVLETMQMGSDVFREKMDDVVGRDGVLLSGGQRQMVWLLRSLFRLKPIIILDEPTASLDPTNKKMVMDSIKKIGIGKTIIVISHDELDGDFKKIYFKDGQIINNGDMFFNST